MEIKPVDASDIPRIVEIEQASYPPEEAGTFESITPRQREEGQLFLGAYIDGSIVGYANASRLKGDILTAESMKVNHPGSPYVGIHSVCVEESHRRRGIASLILTEWLKRAKSVQPAIKTVRLIAHDYMVPYYEKHGFRSLGPSPIVYGNVQWYDMVYYVN